jgi:hypothetical protein
MLEHWVVSFFYANVRWCGDYGVHSKTPSDLPPLLLKRDDQNCLLANKALQGFAQAYRSMEGDSSSFFAVKLRMGNTGTHLLAFQISDAWLEPGPSPGGALSCRSHRKAAAAIVGPGGIG